MEKRHDCQGIDWINAATDSMVQPLVRLNQQDDCPPLRQTATIQNPAQSGFTLIEAIVVIAIIAILAALAAPSFNAAMDKQRLVGAAERMLTDLRWAHAEAIARNQQVRVTFTAGSAWSYTIAAIDAGGGSTSLKTVNGGDFPSTLLSSAAFEDGAGGSIDSTTFSPARVRNPNKGKVTLASSYHSAEISVSALGRTRLCGTMTGYRAC